MSDAKIHLFSILVDARGDGLNKRDELRHFLRREKLDARIDEMGIIGREFEKWTLLTLCAYYGHLSIIQMLIEEFGADPNRADDLGTTPLMYAAYKNHLETVSYLIGLPGIDLMKKNPFENNMTALDYARLNDCTFVMQMLSTNALVGQPLMIIDECEEISGDLAILHDVNHVRQEVDDKSEEIAELQLFVRLHEEEYEAKIESLEQQIDKDAAVSRALTEQNDEQFNRISQLECEIENLTAKLRRFETEAVLGGGGDPEEDINEIESKEPNFVDWFSDTFAVTRGSVWQKYVNKFIETGLDDLKFWTRLMSNGASMSAAAPTSTPKQQAMMKKFNARYVLQNVVGIRNSGNLNQILSQFAKYVEDYSTSVSDWLAGEVQLPFYSATFREHGFENVRDVLQADLDVKDLKDMGVKCVGHRLRILFEIRMKKMSEKNLKNAVCR